jgi:hypothetical protein
MNREEILDAAEADATAAMQAMIDKAVAEERKRCAAIADGFGDEFLSSGSPTAKALLEIVSGRIRMRAKP